MSSIVCDVDDLLRIRTTEEAGRLGLAVYDSFLSQLAELAPAEWESDTVCSPWTVADVVRHVLGAARAAASMREMVRQQRQGFLRRRKHDGNVLDATNALQVEDHLSLSPSELIDELTVMAPAAVRGRMRQPGLLGRVSVPVHNGGSTAEGMPARLNLGDLYRVVYTRDVWLHRIDIARAVGREPALDPETDGRIVEDVIREWSDRHGRPFDLTLTGPLAARYTRPGQGPKVEIDPVDLCWILSGRGTAPPDLPGHDLLRWRLMF